VRDLRKFRNKLTLELDNRQIAFLFAGLLAVLAIVFALGIVVGKGLSRLDSDKAASAGAQAPIDIPAPKQIVADPIEVKHDDLPKGPVELTPSPGDPTINVLNQPPPTQGKVSSSFPLPTETPKAAQTSPPAPTPAIAPPPSEPPSAPKGGGWTVQLSAHQAEAEALARQKGFLSKGIQAYIVKATIAGKGTWYRVRVGQFSTKQGAQQYAEALAAKEGITPFVIPVQ
jgi:DedD protein